MQGGANRFGADNSLHPLKFPDEATYVPATVIGVDGNENLWQRG